jgi:Ca2+-binding RTX toxin-like protein
VVVNLATGTASDGLGGTDTLISIEQAAGGAFNDSITGDAQANRLEGGGGNDTITGGGGTDAYYGGAGNDLLIGGNQSESFSGDDGEDTLIGGAGNDTLNGGNQIDMADYSSAAAAGGGESRDRNGKRWAGRNGHPDVDRASRGRSVQRHDHRR